MTADAIVALLCGMALGIALSLLIHTVICKVRRSKRENPDDDSGFSY